MEHPFNKKTGTDHMSGLAIIICFALLANTGLVVVGEEGEEIDWHSAAQKKLGEKDIKVLQKNGILVTNQAYKQIFEPYLKGTEPFFITSDSLLNAYHVLYEESVLRLEEANANKLPEILRSIHKNLSTVDKKCKGRPELLAAAKKRAIIIIATALRLVNESLRTGDKKLDSIIEQEVKNIVEATKKWEMPVWLGKPDRTFLGLDYSRYKPRGFYTRSEKLERHFRAVAWLQSIPFRVSKDEELVSVLMLGSCIPRSRFADHINKTVEYENFFRGYQMFIGSGDDWDLITAADEAGSGLRLDLSGDDLANVRRELNEKASKYGEGPQINDQLRFAPDDPNAAAEANFRIISAYRTPDGILFHRTTDLRKFKRLLPNGLEVCTALGSAFARERLTYKNKVQLLKTIDEAKSLFSGDSLYFGYLECLTALLDEPEKDAPSFMKNAAWQAKSCNTALGGWAQLRHTWALQAKQTVHYAGITMPPKGFVEPEPEFYSRMALLAERTGDILERTHVFEMDYSEKATMLMEAAVLLERTGTRENLNKEIDKVGAEKFKRFEAAFTIMGYLSDRNDREDLRKPARKLREIAKELREGKLPQEPHLQWILKGSQIDLKSLWKSLGEISRRLETLAHKQLRGEDWNEQDERFITSYGTRIAKIMLYGGNAYLSPNDDAPRVVDVYANPYIPKGYLHVGIARPRAIYVLYPWQGNRILCKGAVLPYYEFGCDGRLTDAEWKRLLDSDQRPAVPEWVRPIVCEGGITKSALKRRRH